MADIPRIYSPPIAAAPLAKAPGPAAPPAKPAPASDPPYLAKLMTMFPAEAITLYTLATKSPINPLIGAIVAVLSLVVVRAAAFRSNETGKTNGMAVLVSVVAFVLWVASTGDLHLLQTFSANATKDDVDHCQAIAAVCIAAWTWVMPNVVKLDPS